MVIPFHLPSIPKPQNQFNSFIDNTNTPHIHSRLPKYGSRYVHPTTACNPLSFVSMSSTHRYPSKPPPIEFTPFKLIENVNDFCYLANKLHMVNEFTVDLKHNSYRPFQGMTCLMQISTRTENFVVDTLILRDYIGKYLRAFFEDPTKRKVMHNANNDVFWLQRDFGIYVCNLFDTIQASRVMKLERNSLEFLLKHYYGMIANKEYQASDWRLRPLPRDMVNYAREDTHYLLHLYDTMFKQLISIDAHHEFECDNPIGEVFKKSYKVSTQLYEKEVFNEAISYLNLYGLSEANLDANQLSVVASLYAWRDSIAREDDESTGYVLPNKLILKIAKRLPKSQEELLELVGYCKEYVLRDADSIFEKIMVLIRDEASTSKFKDVAEKLKNKIPVSEIAAKIQQKERLKYEARCLVKSVRNPYNGGLVVPYYLCPVTPVFITF